MNWLTLIKQENITKKTFFEVIASAYIDNQCELEFQIDQLIVKFPSWCKDPIIVTYESMDYLPPPWLDVLGFLEDILQQD
jgi:hypothetical protein